DPEDTADATNAIAERYVHLVLATGEIDPGYVDAYYGPAEWRETARSENASKADLLERARTLREDLASTDIPADALMKLRREYLVKQIDALVTYLEILGGKELSFD